MSEEPALPPTIYKLENPPAKYVLECEDQKVNVYWDGFCLTFEHEQKFAFVASVNDPTVSPNGNVSIIFGTSEEIAERLPTT